MNLDQAYNRDVRIIGKQGDVTPFQIIVYDAKTGEAIDNIFRVEVVLDVRELNSARLHYYDASSEKRTVTVPIQNIDITAIERKG
jgi:hypothetical protein